jgi:hypothetical protein
MVTPYIIITSTTRSAEMLFREDVTGTVPMDEI